MLVTTVAALLFPCAILAAPASKPAADDHQCRPVSYILTEYAHAKSSSYHFVSFNVQSSWTADTRADDQVKAGANCEADGTSIYSSGHLCNIAGVRVDNLVLYPREGGDDPSYVIHHKWQCNGATWTSVSDIVIPERDCKSDGKEDETVTCTSKPLIYTPQHVVKTAGDDEKKHANKTKVAQPAAALKAKSAGCHECKPSASV